MTGTGDFALHATDANGNVIPTLGTPQPHGLNGSNWNHPGYEVGTGFNFPHSGCWNIHVARSDVEGDLSPWSEGESVDAGVVVVVNERRQGHGSPPHNEEDFMRSAPRGQHSPAEPVALRIKSVELNRSPLWGLYHAPGRSRCAIRSLPRRPGGRHRRRFIGARRCMVNRGVICGLGREGRLRPQ